jgi:hypothetical protein
MTEMLSLRDRAEFVTAMRGWFASFNTVDGEARRQLRIEVLGSSASRPALREEVLRANRNYVSQMAGFLSIIRDRWDLPLEFDPLALASWWVGLLLSRNLVESDPRFVDPTTWDAITDSVVLRLLVMDEE